MQELTLVIPAKNEKESLPHVLRELKAFQGSIIVVMEESDKETINSIKEFNCKSIFQTEKGYGSALIEGIKIVKTKYFCIFNADGSFNPNELENMYTRLTNDDADLIFASRYEKNCSTEDDTIITSLGNFIFTTLGKIFFKLRITDILYTFVMGNTSLVNNLNLKKKDFRFCVELPIKAHWQGLNLKTSKSHERKRIGGKKKVNAFKDGYLILKEMTLLFFEKITKN